MSQTENPIDLKQEYADETMHLIRRLIGGDFTLDEVDGGVPELGPWTNEVAQVIDAFREGWNLAGADESDAQRRDAAKQSAVAKFRALCKENHDLMVMMSGGYSSAPYEPPPPPPIPPGMLCPPMEKGVLVDFTLGDTVCRWHEELIEWIRYWTPTSYPGFIPAASVWTLSTVAARRLVTSYGKDRYTPLMIAFVAYSSEHAKSGVVDMVQDVIETAGLGYLLMGTDPTPQAFWRAFSGHVPENFSEWGEEDRVAFEWELKFAAQKGWIYDEFGNRLRSMLDDKSSYAEYHRILRAVDDCKRSHTPDTIARGRERVKNPYVSLLASLTPPDMQKHARRNSTVWGDGLFGRFAFVYPGEDEPLLEGDYPIGDRRIPLSLSKPLAEWNQRLGIPSVTIAKNKEDRWVATISPLPENYIGLAPDVIDAMNAYYKALRRMAHVGIPDLKSNYIRLNEKCLRIAMLFASFDGRDMVTLPYWAKAQRITEGWRESLHVMYREMVSPPETPTIDIEGRVILQISKKGWVTARDLAGPCKIAITDAHKLCERLVEAGTLIKGKTMHGTDRYAFPMTPEPERKLRTSGKKE